MRREAVLDHIDDLIERGCLAVSTLFFPMLDITEVGRGRLKRLVEGAKTEMVFRIDWE